MSNFKCLNELQWKIIKNDKLNMIYTKLDLTPFDVVTIYIREQYNGKYSCHFLCDNLNNKTFWKFNINGTLMSVYMNVKTLTEAKEIIINRLNELLIELRYDEYKKVKEG